MLGNKSFGFRHLPMALVALVAFIVFFGKRLCFVYHFFLQCFQSIQWAMFANVVSVGKGCWSRRAKQVRFPGRCENIQINGHISIEQLINRRISLPIRYTWLTMTDAFDASHSERKQSAQSSATNVIDVIAS